MACRNHRRVEYLVNGILSRGHDLECHTAGLALDTQDLHDDKVHAVEGDDASQLQFRVGRVVVDMDGFLSDGQLLLHNVFIFTVVVYISGVFIIAVVDRHLSELLEGILFIFVLVLLGEVVGAILVSIARLLVKFVFLIEIRIQLGYFRLFLSQVKQVVEQQVADQGGQVLLVLEDCGKLIDDPLIDHAAESTHLGFHDKG